MAILTSAGKEMHDFNLIVPLCKTDGSVVTWQNKVIIEPRYTSGTTASTKTFTVSGDYQDASNHNVSGSGWSYDFGLLDMHPTGSPWYNYTYDTNMGRRGTSGAPSNVTALNDYSSYVSLYMDIAVGTNPHPGVGNAYAHCAMLQNAFGAHHQWQYSGASVDFTQARNFGGNNNTAHDNFKISGQNYASSYYSQNYCLMGHQAWGGSNIRYLRFINWGGATSMYSKVTILGGQIVIHGQTGTNSGADK